MPTVPGGTDIGGLHVVLVLLPFVGLGLWLQLRRWEAPRVYFSGPPTLADCVRQEVRRAR